MRINVSLQVCECKFDLYPSLPLFPTRAPVVKMLLLLFCSLLTHSVPSFFEIEHMGKKKREGNEYR